MNPALARDLGPTLSWRLSPSERLKATKATLKAPPCCSVCLPSLCASPFYHLSSGRTLQVTFKQAPAYWLPCCHPDVPSGPGSRLVLCGRVPLPKLLWTKDAASAKVECPGQGAGRRLKAPRPGLWATRPPVSTAWHLALSRCPVRCPSLCTVLLPRGQPPQPSRTPISGSQRRFPRELTCSGKAPERVRVFPFVRNQGTSGRTKLQGPLCSPGASKKRDWPKPGDQNEWTGRGRPRPGSAPGRLTGTRRPVSQPDLILTLSPQPAEGPNQAQRDRLRTGRPAWSAVPGRGPLSGRALPVAMEISGQRDAS